MHTSTSRLARTPPRHELLQGTHSQKYSPQWLTIVKTLENVVRENEFVTLENVVRDCMTPKCSSQKYSPIATYHSKCTRALTFKNVCKGCFTLRPLGLRQASNFFLIFFNRVSYSTAPRAAARRWWLRQLQTRQRPTSSPSRVPNSWACGWASLRAMYATCSPR